MTNFARQQQQMRAAVQQTMGPFFPFGGVEEMSRQQMAMMERAMALFTPFYRPPEPEGDVPSTAVGETPTQEEIDGLRAEVERLRQALIAHEAAAAPPPVPATVAEEAPEAPKNEGGS
jgi:polyhydroxyalkanoate synthesis regulator protein